MKTLKFTLTAFLLLALAACANEAPQEPGEDDQQTRVPSQASPKPKSKSSGSSESKEIPVKVNPSPTPTVKPAGSAPTTVQDKCIKKTFAIDLKIAAGQDHMAALKTELSCSDQGLYSDPEIENLDLTNEEKTRCQSPKPVPFTNSTDPTIGFGRLKLKSDEDVTTVEIDCTEVFQRVQYNYYKHTYYDGDMKTWGTFYCCKP